MGARSPGSPHARLLLAVDVVLVAAAFLLAYWIRFGAPLSQGMSHQAAHLILGFAGLASWPPALYLVGLYDAGRFLRVGGLVKRMVQAAVLVALLVAAVLFLFQAKLASRLVLAAYIGFASLFLGGARLVAGRWIVARRRGLRILVIGAGPLAARVRETLPDIRVVGFVADGGEDAVPRDEVLGRLEDLPSILDDQVVDHAVLAVPPQSFGPRVEEATLRCREVGIDVSIVADFFERMIARGRPADLYGIPVVRLYATPQFRAAMLGKRAFDVVVGSVLFLIALPVMLVAALAVRLTSRGPVLFVQERLGLNGRPFRMLKFRTMVPNAEELRPSLEGRNDLDGPAFKLREDPRVTAVGRVLRRLSIDELPQLWNVLRGEMSLVGPRPAIPAEVDRYDRWQRRRLSIRPGITGAWQVSGRSDLGFEDWMRLDLEYIDNWSPWLDLKILLRTVPAVLSGRGAR